MWHKTHIKNTKDELIKTRNLIAFQITPKSMPRIWNEEGKKMQEEPFLLL